MSDGSAIEWTDATWNPLRARNKSDGSVGWHCIKVSEACRHCYAQSMNRRLGTGLNYDAPDMRKVEIYLDEKTLPTPLKWKKPRKIFVCSMTDLFGDWVSDEMLDRIFAVMSLCPQHTFQVLTKRPARMREYISLGDRDRVIEGAVLAWHDSQKSNGYKLSNSLTMHPLKVAESLRMRGDRHVYNWPLRNVWLGVTAENQATADERIPQLLATPAAVRFISAEPLLGSIDLSVIDISGDAMVTPLIACSAEELSEEWGEPIDKGQPRLDWVITGGESGPHARPMHPDLARSIRDQCKAAGVPFFMKQMSGARKSEREAIPSDLLIREYPNAM